MYNPTSGRCTPVLGLVGSSPSTLPVQSAEGNLYLTDAAREICGDGFQVGASLSLSLSVSLYLSLALFLSLSIYLFISLLFWATLSHVKCKCSSTSSSCFLFSPSFFILVVLTLLLLADGVGNVLLFVVRQMNSPFKHSRSPRQS